MTSIITTSVPFHNQCDTTGNNDMLLTASNPAISSSSSSSPTMSLSILEEFICPITQEIMVDPVLSRYGQSYERKAIIEWLASGIHACPMTRQPMTLKDVVTNHRMRLQIETWCESQDIELSQLIRRRRSQSSKPNNSSHDEPTRGEEDPAHDSDDGYDGNYKVNHQAICAAFMDLPESVLNRKRDENGSTGHSSDGDDDEFADGQARSVIVSRLSTRDTTTSSRGQEEPSRRRSILHLWTRRQRGVSQ